MILVDIYEGKSRKTGNKFEAIKLKIGDWETLVFPKSRFEMEYIKNIINEDEGVVNAD